MLNKLDNNAKSNRSDIEFVEIIHSSEPLVSFRMVKNAFAARRNGEDRVNYNAKSLEVTIAAEERNALTYPDSNARDRLIALRRGAAALNKYQR